jgi:hypothetical protein
MMPGPILIVCLGCGAKRLMADENPEILPISPLQQMEIDRYNKEQS